MMTLLGPLYLSHLNTNTQVMQSCWHYTLGKPLQCRTKCKKLTLHSKNVLPELVHTVSRSKLGVSDRAVACGRSSHLTVDEFQMKVCHKVIAFK